MAMRTGDPLAAAALTERERETVQLFTSRLREALGAAYDGMLYAARAALSERDEWNGVE